jgi:tetratricopeptide (TPR) repeat protein
MSTPAPAPAPRRGSWVLPVALLVAAVAAGVTVFLLWPKPPVPPKPPDLDAAVAHNTRGVALMEQRKDAEAEGEFAKAIDATPDWLPARLNYGMALFNQQPAETKELAVQVKKAQEVFREVLAREPDNKHAHYCLGMIDMYVGQYPAAYPHFQKVNQLDPDDAHTWLRLGSAHPDGADSPAAGACYEKAIALDPYLIEAKYKLFIVLRETDPKRADSLLTEHEQLREADRFTESRIVYGEMGKYAEVIGRDPKVMPKPGVGPLPAFVPMTVSVKLADGVTWTAELDPVRKAARDRFGGTVVLFDFNGDSKPDVLLLAAVLSNGKVHDLLLRNDGDGSFTDVTKGAGLDGERASLGAAAADYDNDDKADLVVSTTNGVRLFRNTGGKFEDVTAAAKFDTVQGVFLGCSWADIDLDGDLDLIACKSADTATNFDKPDATGGVVVFENVGVAPPGDLKGPALPLSTAFKPTDAFKDVFPKGSAVAVIAADVDDDHDQDLVALFDDRAPVVAVNDRLMRWRKGTLPAEKARWNGGLVLDANHDGRSDLLLVRATEPPLLLLSNGARDFTASATGPQLLQATAADIDLDGWPDVVGLNAGRKVALLHNQGDGRFDAKPDAIIPPPTSVDGLPKPRVATAIGDLDGDGRPDVLTWNGVRLEVIRTRGANHPLVVTPTGRRDRGSNLRTSNDGFGTWLVAQTGSHWVGAERTTATAGLGQSLLPTVLGMGKHEKADALRVRWADNVIQAELGVATGTPYKLIETNRKGTSCPVLMVWDGERFVFVTDFLGAGALGESGPDGSIRPPRGEESVKVEPGLMVVKNGEYVLKIAEPMDEVLYLDHLQLAVIDHPPTTAVFPDERFVFNGPQPTQKLLAFPSQHRPTKATDHTGTDVTGRVTKRDRMAVDGFKVRSWLGYAENHSLTLEFGELPKADRWHLVLAGWTEYPYPESMYAATRAGLSLQPPVLEQFDTTEQKWKTVCDLGFPAGLPRVMTRELPTAPTGKLRIRTNMQVFWDDIYLAPAEDVQGVTLDVKRADLAARGFMKEVLPDGRPPVAYDDSQTDPLVATWWKGKLTKLGDVTELLTQFDDRFVLCGPGDEITVRFDATKRPELKPGWKRSFVLKSHGYCKDTSTTTATGGQVGPLPFRGMPNYPQFGDAKPPATDAEKWHTRPAR